jgi:hypothetical protein
MWAGLRGGDAPGDHRQHLLDDPEGGAFHPAGDCAGRDRHTEQIRQGRRGTRDGQELSVQQIHADPGQPGPVDDRRRGLRGCGRSGVMPALARQGDQLMLGEVGSHRRDVDHLPPGHVDLDRVGQAATAAPHTSGRCRITTSGSATLCRVVPSCPFGRPGPRPERPRSDLGAGFARPSDDGGFDEFDDDCFNRASRSAIRVRACDNRLVNSVTRLARSSYDGGVWTDSVRQPTSLHNRRTNHPTTYPVTIMLAPQDEIRPIGRG